ncbi:ATP-binding protein [Microbacterium sp. NPDC089189]|uniref:sensor histidine kinase n=1 Tax=Microbacterium sp. NPDC089189 TaxID=3154972 RepID=UPI003431789B
MSTPVDPRPVDIAEDRRLDQRLFVLVVGVLGGVLSLSISTQAVVLLGINAASLRGVEASPLVNLLLRVALNIATIAVAMLVGSRLRLIDRQGVARIVILLVCAAIPAAFRAVLQIIGGFYPQPHYSLTDGIMAMLLLIVTYAFALLAVASQRQARESERARTAQAAQATEALASLQQEELRVRREIADALHGNVQGRVVMMQAELTDVARHLTGDNRARLDRVRAELDDLRENELRAFSASLYPEGIDRGLVPALRALTGRIPAAIGARLVVAPAADTAAALELDLDRRLALVRVAEEAVSNALRHGQATAIDVTVDATADAVVLRVADDGIGVAPDARPSGLARLAERLGSLDGTLDLRDAVDTPTGAVLEARLPHA